MSAKKTHREILEEELKMGRMELDRQWSGTAMSALVAGLEVGFSVLVMGVFMTLMPEPDGVLRKLLVAAAYALGFVFVILGRSELFTEHTALSMLPVLARRATLADLGRQWLVVYGANIAGAVAIAAALAGIAPALGVVEPAAFGEIAHNLVDHPGWVMFGSAVLAGWLMGLVSWLVTASRETVSQIAVVFLVTGTIGLAGLHHCILGTVEVLCGVFAGQGATLGGWLRFLLYATLGNIVGGGFFVALLKYAHATRDRSVHES